MKQYEGEAPERLGLNEQQEALATTAHEDTAQEQGAVDQTGSVETPFPEELDEQVYSDEWEEYSAGGGGFSWPSRQHLLATLPFWAILLLGALLRFWGLGDKPLHHDESMHAYFSLQLLHNMEHWAGCFKPESFCYQYDPLLHGPFQFHAIALVYKISQFFGVPDSGANDYTARIVAATLGTVIVGLPYFLRTRLGYLGAVIASFLLATSPSMVYFARFTREDTYMACFTLLLVVSVACYLRSRKIGWLITASVAFALSYATKEATFLTIAIFGSFFGGLIVWELGAVIARPGRELAPNQQRTFFSTMAPLLMVCYLLVGAVLAAIFFSLLKVVATTISTPATKPAADAFIAALKSWTVTLIPVAGVLTGIYILSILIREFRGTLPLHKERRGIARHIDAQRQPLLDTIFTMEWTHWLLSLLAGWLIFIVLFTSLFTNIEKGIGDGIWQGLYYWLEQQQVARGGQPWYYYLLLIPLYEQIGLVFGLVGVVRSLLHPTRFRLFLVCWLVGNLFIYSWAAEKMPWLMIHMMVPMLLLAAIGLEPLFITVGNWIGGLWISSRGNSSLPKSIDEQASISEGTTRSIPVGAIFGVEMALLLLLPTMQNMYQVSYIHQADAPYEMMIYVQTAQDVRTVMQKIEQLDQKLYNGRRQLPIGVTSGAIWPFAWYLRNYTAVCFNFPAACPASEKSVQVIIVDMDRLSQSYDKYAGSVQKRGDFLYHKYRMRTQWDQGYMPPPCIPGAIKTCPYQPYVGVGPWLWLSYGDNPPPGAQFNPILAAQHIWRWWWERQPFGSVDGSFDMGLFIRKDLEVVP